jgi:archaellum component FlaC
MDVVSRMRRLIGVINEKLDRILERIEHVESRLETERAEILIKELRSIVTDLDELEGPIKSLFEDVEYLREQKYSEAEDLWKE